jgi:hypothetical protein
VRLAVLHDFGDLEKQSKSIIPPTSVSANAPDRIAEDTGPRR